MYEYMHDQTLQLINQGYVPMEIAETLKRLPPQLARKWYNRPYYGSLSFNVRAIYQRYLGFYDANPAHLDPLEPVDAARKYVEFMGGPQAVVAKARDSYSRGEYRWVAEVVNHVIFAGSGDTPIDGEARELQASALEQLGFQCENGTWRNAYLMGAYELRRGVPGYTPVGTLVVDLAAAMPVSSIFDWIGIAVDRMLADGKLIVLNWIFTQPLPEQRYVLTLRNSALTYREHDLDREADATLRLTKYTLDAIISGQSTFANEIAEGNISVEGDGAKVIELFAIAHVSGTPMFNVVTP
jgi:alkyl sulfatase BDS1-like metallo-beta-lactamase superfamily hydrolase